MKKIILFSVLFASLNFFAQQTNLAKQNTSPILNELVKKATVTINKINASCVLDSILDYQWNSSNSAYNSIARHLFKYSTGNNPDTITSQNWNTNNYVNSAQVIYTYTTGNNFLTQVQKLWNNNQWENTVKIKFVYSAGKRINDTIFIWNAPTSSWKKSQAWTYSYNASNKVTNRLIKNWNNTSWDNFTSTSYTYNANNYVSYTLEESWTGTVWQNTSNTTFTYDANNNNLTQLGQNWNSGWVNDYYLTNTFDANNNNLSTTNQQWSTNPNIWTNSWRHLFTYDANNNLTIWLTESWFGNTWQNHMKTMYYNNCNVGIHENKLSTTKFSVYPNPSSSTIYLNTTKEIKNVIITNINGQIQLETAVKEISVSELNAGIYFVTVTNKDGSVMTTKFIKD